MVMTCKCKAARNLHAFVVICYVMCYGISALALDNPDAPDYVGEFLDRAQVHELDIQRTAHTTQGCVSAYEAYQNFLDADIDKAYKLLMGRLDRDAQGALRDSQQKWLKHRDAESEFITLNWTMENFGSSSVISRGGYRTTISKNRVTQLLYYLQNYPNP